MFQVLNDTEVLPLRVLAVEHDSPIATARLTFQTGAIHDPTGVSGMAHLVEHLCCDATKRHTSTERNLAIAKLGESNAFTDAERVAYWISFRPNDAYEAIRTLLEGPFLPAFSDEAFDRERKIIEQEIRQRADHQTTLVCDKALGFYFGDRWANIAGNVADLDALKFGGMVKYWTDHYHAANSHLTIAGPRRMVADARRAIAEILEAAPTGATFKRPLSLPRPKWNPYDMQRRTIASPHDSASVFVAVPGVHSYSELRDLFATDLVGQFFGGGLYGLLMRRLREELGLVYGAWAWHQSYRSTGVFQFGASTGYENRDRVVEEIHATLDAVKDGKIDATIETAVAEACVSARLFTQSRWKETTGKLTNTLLNYWPDAAPDELAEAFDKMTDPATYEDAVEKIRFVAGSWGREMRITTVTERAS